MKKVFALIFLFAAAGMFFLPWTRICMKHNGEMMTLGQVVERAVKEQGLSMDQVWTMLEQRVLKLNESMSVYEASLDAEKAVTQLKNLIDGSVSPYELIRTTTQWKFVLEKVGEASRIAYGVDPGLKTLAMVVDISAVTLWILAGVVGIVFLLAFILIFPNKKGGTLAFAITYLLMILGTVLVVWLANLALRTPSNSEAFLYNLGMRGSNLVVIQHTAYGFLGCVLAWMAFIAMCLRTDKPQPQPVYDYYDQPEEPDHRWADETVQPYDPTAGAARPYDPSGSQTRPYDPSGTATRPYDPASTAKPSSSGFGRPKDDDL